MKKLLSNISAGLMLLLPVPAFAGMLFHDSFNQESIDLEKWSIPYWNNQILGRTYFNTLSFPNIENGNAVITVASYNPEYRSGESFYGTDLKTEQLMPLTRGYVHLKVRAKMDTSVPGIVAGIFLFAFRPGSTDLHDEIDFEMVTTEPKMIMTNSYLNEPLGPGQPKLTWYEEGTSMTDYHLYEILWEPDKVSWFLDGRLIREERDRVPEIPMKLHLNAWVTDDTWPQAYSPDLQPAARAEDSQMYGMRVDFVEIRTKSTLAPALHLLLKK